MLKLRSALILKLTTALGFTAVAAAVCCLYLGTTIRDADIKSTLDNRASQAVLFIDSKSLEALKNHDEIVNQTKEFLEKQLFKLKTILTFSLNGPSEPEGLDYHNLLIPQKGSDNTDTLRERLEETAMLIKDDRSTLDVMLLHEASGILTATDPLLSHVNTEEGRLTVLLGNFEGEVLKLVTVNGTSYAVLFSDIDEFGIRAALLARLDDDAPQKNQVLIADTLGKIQDPLILSSQGNVIYLNNAARKILDDRDLSNLKEIPADLLTATSQIADYEVTAVAASPGMDRMTAAILLFSIAIPAIALVYAASLIYNFTVTVLGDINNLHERILGTGSAKIKTLELNSCCQSFENQFAKAAEDALKDKEEALFNLKNQSLRRELEHICASLLPQSFPETEFLDLHASVTDSQIPGGAFYNVLRVDEDNIGYYLGVVKSDDPLERALGMFYVTTLFEEGLRLGRTPSEILTLVSMRIREHNRPNTCALCGISNEKTGNFIMAKAGSIKVFLTADLEVSQLQEQSTPLLGTLSDDPENKPLYSHFKGTLVQQDKLFIFPWDLVEQNFLSYQDIKGHLEDLSFLKSKDLIESLNHKLAVPDLPEQAFAMLAVRQTAIRFRT